MFLESRGIRPLEATRPFLRTTASQCLQELQRLSGREQRLGLENVSGMEHLVQSVYYGCYSAYLNAESTYDGSTLFLMPFAFRQDDEPQAIDDDVVHIEAKPIDNALLDVPVAEGIGTAVRASRESDEFMEFQSLKAAMWESDVLARSMSQAWRALAARFGDEWARARMKSGKNRLGLWCSDSS